MKNRYTLWENENDLCNTCRRIQNKNYHKFYPKEHDTFCTYYAKEVFRVKVEAQDNGGEKLSAKSCYLYDPMVKE